MSWTSETIATLVNYTCKSLLNWALLFNTDQQDPFQRFSMKRSQIITEKLYLPSRKLSTFLNYFFYYCIWFIKRIRSQSLSNDRCDCGNPHIQMSVFYPFAGWRNRHVGRSHAILIDLSRIPLRCVRTKEPERVWGGHFHMFVVFLSTLTLTPRHCSFETRESSIDSWTPFLWRGNGNSLKTLRKQCIPSVYK